MQTYQKVLRWMALVPASYISAILAYYLVGGTNRFIMWASGINPNSFLMQLFIEFITHAAYGLVFVLVATIVAPCYRKQVGFVMVGVIAICTIGLIYFDIIDGKHLKILGDISTLLGAGVITWAMWTAQTWGRDFISQRPEKLRSNIDPVSPAGREALMYDKPKYEEMPDPNQPVCRLMQEMLEAHMAEFNPRQLKELEDSGKLQEYLEDQSSQARLIYLQCRKAGMSQLQAGEVARLDLYPEPEGSEGTDEAAEVCHRSSKNVII